MDERVRAMRERLLAVFKELRREGFLARANFKCCQTCAGYALAREAAELLKKKGKEIRGVVFWHRQDEDDLRHRGYVWLAYGRVHTKEFGPLGLPTVEVGRILCKKLEKYGLVYEWDGNPNTRIRVVGVVDNGGL